MATKTLISTTMQSKKLHQYIVIKIFFSNVSPFFFRSSLTYFKTWPFHLTEIKSVAFPVEILHEEEHDVGPPGVTLEAVAEVLVDDDSALAYGRCLPPSSSSCDGSPARGRSSTGAGRRCASLVHDGSLLVGNRSPVEVGRRSLVGDDSPLEGIGSAPLDRSSPLANGDHFPAPGSSSLAWWGPGSASSSTSRRPSLDRRRRLRFGPSAGARGVPLAPGGLGRGRPPLGVHGLALVGRHSEVVGHVPQTSREPIHPVRIASTKWTAEQPECRAGWSVSNTSGQNSLQGLRVATSVGTTLWFHVARLNYTLLSFPVFLWWAIAPLFSSLSEQREKLSVPTRSLNAIGCGGSYDDRSQPIRMLQRFPLWEKHCRWGWRLFFLFFFNKFLFLHHGITYQSFLLFLITSVL